MFHRIGPFRKPNAPILTKHTVRGKPVDPTSTTATGVGTAGVVIAGTLQWPDAFNQTHSGTKVSTEKTIPGLSCVVNNQVEHARMDLVFDQHGATTYLDVAIVSLFSTSPAHIAAASTRPGMARRREKIKIDRYPHVNLETTCRRGYHATKFISNLMKDANPPSLAIRDTWSAVQSVLHSAISKQQFAAAAVM